MITCGVVAEYNPFHLGHEALLRELRQRGATHIAVVMAGSFTQRGEPAIAAKWLRAKAALLCGADLVVELPLPWAMSGAEHFALGGVAVLDSLGCQWLGCGSECGDAKLLAQAADALLSPSFAEALHRAAVPTEPFAKSRQRAVEQLAGIETGGLLATPNNILAVEYLKAIRSIGSSMRLQTMKRAGAGHHEGEAEGIASAGEIRRRILSGQPWEALVPAPTIPLLRQAMEKGESPGALERMERAVLAKLRTMNREGFAALPDVSGGLESRLYNAARVAGTLDEFYKLAKTKCYAHARIRRAALSAFLGVNQGHGEGLPPYIRVLGMNQRGVELLKSAKVTTKMPILVNSSDVLSLDSKATDVFNLECESTDLFALALPRPTACGQDFTHKMIMI